MKENVSSATVQSGVKTHCTIIQSMKGKRRQEGKERWRNKLMLSLSLCCDLSEQISTTMNWWILRMHEPSLLTRFIISRGIYCRKWSKMQEYRRINQNQDVNECWRKIKWHCKEDEVLGRKTQKKKPHPPKVLSSLFTKFKRKNVNIHSEFKIKA